MRPLVRLLLAALYDTPCSVCFVLVFADKTARSSVHHTPGVMSGSGPPSTVFPLRVRVS